MLDATSSTFLRLIYFSTKKTGNTNACFKVLIIEGNLTKSLIAKKVLLIIKTLSKSKI